MATHAKVGVVTLSPNFWGDNAVGNKHTLYVLAGAKNEETCAANNKKKKALFTALAEKQAGRLSEMSEKELQR